MLYKVAITLEFVDEIFSVTIQMKATEQYFSVVLFKTLYTGDSNFVVCGLNPRMWPFKYKVLSMQYSPWSFFLDSSMWL